ncbi:MAG: hypothetical protein ACI4WS_13500 [Oscillospiraceae bacterium]
MNKKMMVAAAAAAVFFSAAGSSSAYTLYSEGKSAEALSGSYFRELQGLNYELNEAVKNYTTTPPETTETQPEQTVEATGGAAGSAEAQPGSPQEGAPEAAGSAEAQPEPPQEEAPEAAGSAEAQPEPPQEEPPDAAALYTELIGLAQEYHSQTAKTGTELAGRLMDYDLALKKLKILISRYDNRKEYAQELEKLALTGECDAKTAQAAKDEADSRFYDVKALMFDISVMKSDIEGMTGEPLKDDFDFNSVYLITDALKLDGEALRDRSQLGTLYTPEGAEVPELEETDCSPMLNDSVQAYYSLGSALREYLSAVSAEKEGESLLKLGELTADELQKLTEDREDKFLTAVEAKGGLSKALLALDEALGKAVSGRIISPQEKNVLCGTLTDDDRGTGMWIVFRTIGGTELCPVSYPGGTYPIDEDDDAYYSYTIAYDGQEIGTAVVGASCRVSDIVYRDGVNYAEVTFYRSGVRVGTYWLNIFTPYGEFV